MCGIAGVFGVREPTRVATRLADALAHRGPDDAGVEAVIGADGEFCGALAHRRLSILDLSAAGHQPMVSHDGRFTIALNGEIYNYKALRTELMADGVSFRSASDTEVLLEGFARHGTRFLKRLRGMYAVAIWDRATSRAYLFRDPFGIKPLYLAPYEGGVVFASEIRAIVRSGAVPARISREAMRGYLEWGAVPEPLTIVSDIVAIEPGTVVSVAVRDGSITTSAARFASVLEAEPAALESDPARAAKLVREALQDSVEHHLVSDVPVGLFLSGGIDSSAVVALASQVREKLETFTITFGQSALSEAAHARAVATRFNTVHQEILLTGADLFGFMPAAFAAMDQPSMDGINTYAVSRAVRARGIKVVLSGLGGDELFAGYPSFRRAAMLAPIWNASWPLRRGAEYLGYTGALGGKLGLVCSSDDPAAAAYSASRALFTSPILDALHGAERPADRHLSEPPALSLLQRVSALECSGYMRNVLLRDSDVFSMAHGLELRVPFLDRAVAAASLAVSDSTKLTHGRSKPLLIAALGELLPRDVWDRPKQGFVLPFDQWMRTDLRGEVAEALTSEPRLSRVGLRPDAARAVWNGFLARKRGFSWSRPWALYTLVRWAEELDAYCSSAPSVTGVPARTAGALV